MSTAEAKKREFKCVDKEQFEADPYHADWMLIKAETSGKAKSIYSQHTGTKFTKVKCFEGSTPLVFFP